MALKEHFSFPFSPFCLHEADVPVLSFDATSVLGVAMPEFRTKRGGFRNPKMVICPAEEGTTHKETELIHDKFCPRINNTECMHVDTTLGHCIFLFLFSSLWRYGRYVQRHRVNVGHSIY